MKTIPHYPKVLTLGSAYTENIFNGEVVIQEKVDGSMFRFGINEDGQLVMGSKSVAIYEDNYPAMFKEAVEYVKTLKLNFEKDTYFYCEYLQNEKHNVLKYERIPKNHLVLFDCLVNGKWLDQNELKMTAENLGIDVIPTLYEGDANVEKVRQLLETKSYLGGETVEGVVIKNYKQTILLGGNVYPLFTKYVREQFKERHQTEWKVKSPKGAIQQYLEGFKSEARWQKAYQYLRDKGEIEKSPRDIGKLIKRVQDDIVEEEKENIKNELYKMFIKDILRTATKGIAEWYKDFLIKSLENK